MVWLGYIFCLLGILCSSSIFAQTEDFMGEVLCARGVRILSEIHPRNTVSAKRNDHIRERFIKARLFIERMEFLPMGQIESELIAGLGNLDPAFYDFWEMIAKGYERMPPHFKREILIEYIDYRLGGAEVIESGFDGVSGMAQALSLKPGTYGFTKGWNFYEYFKWQKEHPISAEIPDHRFIFDSSMYATNGSTYSKIQWYEDLLPQLGQAFGLEDLGVISMPPTVILEQGAGGMPSVRRRMGAFALDPAFRKPLSAAQMSFIERSAYWFSDIGVGKEPGEAAKEDIIPDDWILAEAVFSEGTFLTMDRNLARPLEEFLKIDPVSDTFNKPKASRKIFRPELGLEISLAVTRWKYFSGSSGSQSVPVIELEIKDSKTDEIYRLNVIRLQRAPIAASAWNSTSQQRTSVHP